MPKGNHRTKGTLRFALKEPSSSKESPIQLDYSLGSTRIRKSTGYKILPAYWDRDKQRVKNVIKAVRKDEINRELNDLANHIEDGISDLRKTKANISKKDVESIIESYKSDDEDEKELGFFELFEKFIALKEKMLPPNRGSKNQTVEVYKQGLKFVQDFQRQTSYKVDFETIDLDFYASFRKYMQSLKKNDGASYSLNTIGKHLKTLKTFLNYASNNGYNTNLKYKSPEFKILKEETTAVYLTKEEKRLLF